MITSRLEKWQKFGSVRAVRDRGKLITWHKEKPKIPRARPGVITSKLEKWKKHGLVRVVRQNGKLITWHKEKLKTFPKAERLKIAERLKLPRPRIPEDWITCSVKYNETGSVIDCSVTTRGSEEKCKNRLKKYVNKTCFGGSDYWVGDYLILNTLDIEIKCERPVDEIKEEEEICERCPRSKKGLS